MDLSAFIACGAAGSPTDHALACRLGLQGLRVSEGCSIDAEDLGMGRGHRIVTVVGKGSTLAVIPLPPRIAQAIDLAAGDRRFWAPRQVMSEYVPKGRLRAMRHANASSLVVGNGDRMPQRR